MGSLKWFRVNKLPCFFIFWRDFKEGCWPCNGSGTCPGCFVLRRVPLIHRHLQHLNWTLFTSQTITLEKVSQGEMLCLSLQWKKGPAGSEIFFNGSHWCVNVCAFGCMLNFCSLSTTYYIHCILYMYECVFCPLCWLTCCAGSLRWWWIPACVCVCVLVRGRAAEGTAVKGVARAMMALHHCVCMSAFENNVSS